MTLSVQAMARAETRKEAWMAIWVITTRSSTWAALMKVRSRWMDEMLISWKAVSAS